MSLGKLLTDAKYLALFEKHPKEYMDGILKNLIKGAEEYKARYEEIPTNETFVCFLFNHGYLTSQEYNDLVCPKLKEETLGKHDNLKNI